MADRYGEKIYLELFIEKSGLNITNIVQSSDEDESKGYPDFSFNFENKKIGFETTEICLETNKRKESNFENILKKLRNNLAESNISYICRVKFQNKLFSSAEITDCVEKATSFFKK